MKALTSDNRHIAIYAFLLLCAAGTGWVFRDYHFDDPFYCYRYALNLAEGKGWVYNAGIVKNASTSALHTLILSALTFFTKNLPAIAHVTGTLFLAGSAAVVFRLMASSGMSAGGFFAALLIIANPLFLITFGKETMLFILTAGLAWHLYFTNRYTPAAACLALLFLTRPDGILVALICVIDFINRQRRFPALPLFVFLMITAPWLMYSLYTFGSPFPSTLGTKMKEGAVFYGALSYLKGLYFIGWHYRPVAFVLLPVFMLSAGGAVSALITRDARYRLILYWILLHVGAYTLIHPPPFETYYVAPAFGCILLSGLFFQRMSERPGRIRAAATVTAAALALASVASLNYYQRFLNQPEFRYYRGLKTPIFFDYVLFEHDAYAKVGLWLKHNTPTDALIGMEEAGIMGYYSSRNITDLYGVVSSANPGDGIKKWVDRFQPDYIVLPFHIPLPAFSRQKARCYVECRRFHLDNFPDMLVYQKHDSSPCQPMETAHVLTATGPVYKNTKASPPVFSWSGTGFHTFDMIYHYGIWNEYIFRSPVLDKPRYIIDDAIWSQIPDGAEIMWRITRVNPEAPSVPLSRSDMRRFVKN